MTILLHKCIDIFQKKKDTPLQRLAFLKKQQKTAAKTSVFDKKVVPLRPNSINIMSNSLTFKKL